jgi:hypothetical protein
MNRQEINLKIKTGKDSYFIANGKRLDKLNRLLREEGSESIFFQEDDSVFWIKTDLRDDGDICWVEATVEEVEVFLASGDKSFFKKAEINIK